MRFFRGLNKVLFWISFGMWMTAVLTFSIIFFCNRYIFGYGFLVLFLGSLIVVTAHTMWGMLTEFFDNVAAIRKNTQPNNAQQSFVAVAAQPAAPVYMQQPAQPVQPVQQPAYTNWFCPTCGTNNSGDSQFCANCGNRH